MAEPDATFRYTSYALIIFLFIFFVGILTIVIITLTAKEKGLPDKVDVVLFSDGIGDTTGKGENRLKLHVNAVKKHLCFANRIWVVDAGIAASDEQQQKDTTLGVYRVSASSLGLSSTSTPNEVLLKTHELSFDAEDIKIADDILFLSDNIVPMKNVELTYLFAYEHPRVFNVLRSQAIQTAFNRFLDDTVPMTAVIPKSLISQSDTDGLLPSTQSKIDALLFRLTTEKLAVRRPGLSRDILMSAISQSDNNFTQQQKQLRDHTPLFATFHVNAAEITDATARNGKEDSVNMFLEEYFKINR